MDETTNSVPESGDDLTAAPPEQEAPETAAIDVSEPVEGVEAEPDAPASEEDDTEDYQLDGKSYKVPKALKPLLMMQQDYTRKTQEVAEHRKALEQERAALTQQAEQQRTYIGELAQLTSIDAQIEQFKGVNWQALEADDPIRAAQLFRQYSMLRDRKSEIGERIARQEQERSVAQQREYAKQVQEAEAVLSRDIKGWGPELATKLTSFAGDMGFSAEELRGITDPRVIKVLHAAYQSSQTIAKKIAEAKAPPPKAPAPIPTTVGKGANSPVKDPSKMSMSEYADHYNRLDKARRVPR